MSINSKIITAISPYCPCVYGAYLGSDEEYAYFIFPQDSVALSGSDEAILDNVPVQVHLFTPDNYLTLKKQIRTALKKAGFTYPNVTCLFEGDTKLNHIIFECETIVASEKEEE